MTYETFTTKRSHHPTGFPVIRCPCFNVLNGVELEGQQVRFTLLPAEGGRAASQTPLLSPRAWASGRRSRPQGALSGPRRTQAIGTLTQLPAQFARRVPRTPPAPGLPAGSGYLALFRLPSRFQEPLRPLLEIHSHSSPAKPGPAHGSSRCGHGSRGHTCRPGAAGALSQPGSGGCKVPKRSWEELAPSAGLSHGVTSGFAPTLPIPALQESPVLLTSSLSKLLIYPVPLSKLWNLGSDTVPTVGDKSERRYLCDQSDVSGNLDFKVPSPKSPLFGMTSFFFATG